MVVGFLQNMQFPPCWLLLQCCLITVSVQDSPYRPELQPNDVASGAYDDLDHDDPYLCTRTCRVRGKPRLCYYQFHVESYNTLGRACRNCSQVQEDCFGVQCVPADGVERAILTVNRMLPGPSIQVCKGDTLLIDVINMMDGISTAIHWHGVHQRRTKWMDGVPMVTQCPILAGQTFQYRFSVSDAGTHFWHSHDGLQKVDGIVGSLIVREPDITNPVREFYDHDLPSHVIVIQDWLHEMANDRLPGLQATTSQPQDAETYLIQGRGVYGVGLDADSLRNATPLAVFKVKAGDRYRFRLISGTCLSCPYTISFQNHKVMVINSDDSPLEPRGRFDSITLSAGERYDVVVTADKSVAQYWIMVQGLEACTNITQVAILQYEGANELPDQLPKWSNRGFNFNMHKAACNWTSLQEGLCYSQARSRLKNPPRISDVPDKQIIMFFGFYPYVTPEDLFQPDSYHKYIVPRPNLLLAGHVRNNSYIMPPSPLLTQYYDIPPEIFCNRSECDTTKFCECLDIIHLDYYDLVEFIIADSDVPSMNNISHPFHVHGHSFYVVEQGLFKPPYKKSLAELLERRERTCGHVEEYLPGKDTVQVPPGGYTIVRMLAENPGYWLWHCHFAFHMASGMANVIEVGPPGLSYNPPPGFPRCYQYLPDWDPSPYHY